MNEETTRMRVPAALANPNSHHGIDAQLFKCKGPDARSIYSRHTRCEASARAGRARPGGQPRARNEARAAAQKAEDAQGVAAAHASGGLAWLVTAPAQCAADHDRGLLPALHPVVHPYKVSGSDEQRLRNLEVTHSAGSLSNEQKQSVQWEMDAIRDGRDAKMSSSDRARRDALAQDVGSVDKAKRYRNLGEHHRASRSSATISPFTLWTVALIALIIGAARATAACRAGRRGPLLVAASHVPLGHRLGRGGQRDRCDHDRTPRDLHPVVHPHGVVPVPRDPRLAAAERPARARNSPKGLSTPSR